MPRLIWDKVGERIYETGLDRGVLYLPDKSAVPWNGLTSIIESFDKEVSPIYYDGMKISDLVTLGDFSATMKAVTYPDEFIELEGIVSMRRGFLASDQKPQLFGLCYRTQIGNDLEGDVTGYKIHILYNVTAIPHEKTYASVSSDPSLVEFEWDITAIPEDIPGLRPTAHFTIKSSDVDPWLLEELEDMLYGSSSANASLIPLYDLVSFIKEWYRVKIIDNGDGTWTAISKREGFIHIQTSQLFEIINVNAVYLNDFTFIISDTLDVFDVPQIRIVDNGDGTWSAVTDHDNLIIVDDNNMFQILNANAEYLDADTYQISDTIE